MFDYHPLLFLSMKKGDFTVVAPNRHLAYVTPLEAWIHLNVEIKHSYFTWKNLDIKYTPFNV